MRDASSAARFLVREPTATISCLVCARTDSMNRSAIQPEPRIPHRKICASAAGSIRDAGNDIGNGIECLNNDGGCYASALIPKQARLCFFARMILLGLSIRFTATIHVPDSTWV